MNRGSTPHRAVRDGLSDAGRVPGVMDVSKETDDTFGCTGKTARTPGTFAANCLLAGGWRRRRQFVRSITGLGPSRNLHKHRTSMPGDRQASAALIVDLKAACCSTNAGGLGRRVRTQPATRRQAEPRPTTAATITRLLQRVEARRCEAGSRLRGHRRLQLQRDRHRPVHVHDFHATLLHLLGVDHER